MKAPSFERCIAVGAVGVTAVLAVQVTADLLRPEPRTAPPVTVWAPPPDVRGPDVMARFWAALDTPSQTSLCETWVQDPADVGDWFGTADAAIQAQFLRLLATECPALVPTI